jgi:hypothetical protein
MNLRAREIRNFRAQEKNSFAKIELDEKYKA